jgi:hypothetical protein
MAAVCPLTGDRVIGFIRLTISAIPFSSPSPFPSPFDFCCFRAVTARPTTTFLKVLCSFFILIFAVFEPLYCNEISCLLFI